MRQSRFVSLAFLVALMCPALIEPASAQSGRVGGIVRGEDGQPIKGATVTAENPNIAQSFTATTDDKGRFVMIGLRGGQWRFISQAPGYSPEGTVANVRMGTPNPPVSFALRRTGNDHFGALGGLIAKDLQADLARADALFEEQRWDEAISAYRGVLTEAPPLGVIHLQIATAYRLKKDYAAALDAYSELLKSEPNNDKAVVGIALTQRERGDVDAAERTLVEAALVPDAGRDVFYALADLKLERGELDQASAYYQKAADADPAWGKPLYMLGMGALKKGDTSLAAKLLQQVIAVDPVSAEAVLAKTSLETLNK
ncbi:MAG: tetratricopeptide repeat protein [Luteitalea sp.]|nr:tetratricopeptide repeat protein [Luteitalea sp.]